jgi:next-to-BRCA1 protein 1
VRCFLFPHLRGSESAAVAFYLASARFLTPAPLRRQPPSLAMAATTSVPVTLDTPIAIKILFRGQTRKLKLPLKDLGAHVLPLKLRAGLQVLEDEELIVERYSDSAGAYVTLDADKPQIYKTLFRAAKAKLKLRLRAHVPGDQFEQPLPPPPAAAPAAAPAAIPAANDSFRMSAETLTPHVVAPVSPLIVRSPDAPKFEAVSPVSPPQPEDAKDEAPVPQSFTARQSFFNHIASAPHNADLAFRPKPIENPSAWVVYCNNCNHPMDDEHFHCSVCDGGDYDLCPSCVDSGIHCPGSGHWMVKRFVKNGCVVNSTTQRIPPKIKAEPEVESQPQPQPEEPKEVPGAFTDEKQSVYNQEPTRTCNCCVNILSEKFFVTCTSCEDYDLCLDCHVSNKHGHHPGHAFQAATSETALPALAHALCTPGRNARHSAVCDGCDKFIYGVRHKCLNCPDWDYCSECAKSAKVIHPRHRFVPIYEPLSEPLAASARHYGIYCDGPLCKDRENLSYIEGVRYKCAVCHDTDFCQSCEAHPSNKHNHTHPLIKLKTPVRSVSVTTLNENRNGNSLSRLGDQHVAAPCNRSISTETKPVAASTNAATQVQTIVDMKPSAEPVEKDAEPITEKTLKTQPKSDGLDAHFIRDTIVDGTKIFAGQEFVQTWTLRNPGPQTWPAGCSVRHVGGDNMLNVDNTRALSQSELSNASESNVIGVSIAPGTDVSFRVVMKAPQREGTAISYWRLKTADGTPFGHRLWCDVQIVAPPSPASQPMPALSGGHHGFLAFPHEHQRILLAKQAQAMAMQQRAMAMQQQSRTRSFEQPQNDMNDVHRRHSSHKTQPARKEDEYTTPVVPAQSETVKIEDSQQTAELPVEEKSPECQPELKSSGMIFPQLDKESPESSTHEASTAQPVSPVSVKSTLARTLTVASEEEFFEDAESVALHSDDDGFMTDEEYDILDASDEEMR